MSAAHHPKRNALLCFGITSSVLAGWFHLSFGVPGLLAWLLACNGVATGIWGFDKWSAKREGARVPELVLHTMAFLGATPASLLGMACLRHKTRRWRFVVLHPILLAIQAGLVVAIYLDEWRAWLA
jgi:uncharacterized membrane protein YsdA (DUF1294 family)